MKFSLFLGMFLILSWKGFSQPTLSQDENMNAELALADKGKLFPMDVDTTYSMATPASWLYRFWNTDHQWYSDHNNEVSLEKVMVVVEDPKNGKFYVHPKMGTLNSRYGPRRRRNHYGIDIGLHTGDPVYVAMDGMVRFAAYEGAMGKVVVIRHANGLETVYAHLSRINVQPNQIVGAGQVVGLGGSTGRASGPHLHYEIRYLGRALNPEKFIDFTTGHPWSDTVILDQSFLRKNGWVKEEPVEDLTNDTLIEGEVGTGDSLVASDTMALAPPPPLIPDPPKVEKPKAPAPKYHTVKSGETLSAISRKHGISVNTLYKLNKLNERSVLQIGQKVRIK